MTRILDDFSIDNPHCSVGLCFEVIGGRWKGIIIYHLLNGTKRFSELKRLIPAVSQRMLTAQLRQLEQDGIVHREVFPVVPPHVEYSLTEIGFKLQPIIELIDQWGTEYWNMGQNSKK